MEVAERQIALLHCDLLYYLLTEMSSVSCLPKYIFSSGLTPPVENADGRRTVA
uniref:Uncharacterized protein n=1 Tax=Heterorhabditis bacteriophora TaxID=37862 RepID=A0A1I7W7X2_HETBA